MHLTSDVRTSLVAVAGLVLMSAGVGCQSSGEGAEADDSARTMTSAPKQELLAALEQTSEAASFRWSPLRPSGEPADGATRPGDTYTDYAASDRARTVVALPGESVDFFEIGSDAYVNVAGQPGKYMRVSAPGLAMAGDIAEALEEMHDAVEAAEVSRDPDDDGRFFVEIPAGLLADSALDGEATVEDGYLVSWASTTADTGEDRGRVGFSRFDAVPPIQAPPDDALLPYDRALLPIGGGLEPCGPDGLPPSGALICGESSGIGPPPDTAP